MAFPFPKSIRAKTTLIVSLTMALAMALVVLVVSFAMQEILKNTISESLRERLDVAQAAVASGDYNAAIDAAGNDMLQVVDENGKVLAATPNSRPYADILSGVSQDSDDDDSEFEIELDDLKLRYEGNGAEQLALLLNTVVGDAVARTNRVALTADNVQATIESMALASEAQEAAQGQAGIGQPEPNQPGSTPNTASAPQAYVGDDVDDDVPDYDEPDYDEPDDDYDEPDYDYDEPDYTYSTPAYDYDEPDDDWQPVPTPAPAPDYDDDYEEPDYEEPDYEEPDYEEPDYDDDGDDDDDERRVAYFPSTSRKGGASKALYRPAPMNPLVSFVGGLFAPSVAWAEESQGTEGASEVSYTDASKIFGDAGPYEVMKRKVESPDGQVTLVAVTSLASALQASRTAAGLLALVLGIVFLLASAFTWVMTGRTLLPVNQMRHSVEGITTGNLSERVPVPDGDRDLSRLATTFNGMLERIEASLVEQKQFISNASHELKSPVAATSIMLEALRTHPDAVNQSEVLDDMVSENERMGAIVGDLLTLTRYDEGRMQKMMHPKPLDMMDLLYEEAGSLASRTSVKVDTSEIAPVICVADADMISHAVRNLLDNAARYAENQVKLSCSQVDEGWLRITVSDDGPGVPVEEREHVFERFVHLGDKDNLRQHGSTGLGLSVVRSVVGCHGGKVYFTDPEINGATVVIDLPCE